MMLLAEYTYPDGTVVNKIFKGDDHIRLVEESREDECYKKCKEVNYKFFEGGEYGDI